MNREQLAHILRAASDVTKDPEIVVLGSQAILGAFDEDHLPPAATASVEADLAWLADSAERERAEMVNGEIGEMSGFHDAFGVYPEGISIQTATLPAGWRDRLHTWDVATSGPARPLFLEKHDLAAAKLARFESKDTDFVAALVEHDLLHLGTLRDRVDGLPVAPAVKVRIQTWLDGLDPRWSRGGPRD